MTAPDRAAEVARFEALHARLHETKTLPTTSRRRDEAAVVERHCRQRLRAARFGNEPLWADLTIAYDRLEAQAETAKRTYEDQLVKESRTAFAPERRHK